MIPLQFPQVRLKVKNTENKQHIFDKARKKWIRLTPEEWVRQHTLHFLNDTKGYPLPLIAVEKQIYLNGLPKRFDLLVFNNTGQPMIIVECKSPALEITQAAFDQIARYNMPLKAKYLMVTNGLVHYYCSMDYDNRKYIFLRELPDFGRD